MPEFDRIARYFAPLASNAPEAAGLLDDAAFITPNPGEQWVITTDAISEGVHYVGDEPADLIARKLLRTNLSDLAAKGATPKFYTLNIMLPKATPDAWVEQFAAGLALDQEHYGIQLIGGDSISVRGNHASFSATLFGVVTAGARPLRRSGAQVNDLICMSGTLGDAAHYLKHQSYAFTDADVAYFKERYTLPEPRLKLGKSLLGLATSCMDISDGLVQDIGHIARASKLGVFINAVDVKLSNPLMHYIEKHPEAQTSIMQTALTGGDDYELLFTLPEHNLEKAKLLAERSGVAVTPIGRMTSSNEVTIIGLDGKAMDIQRGGYSH